MEGRWGRGKQMQLLRAAGQSEESYFLERLARLPLSQIHLLPVEFPGDVLPGGLPFGATYFFAIEVGTDRGGARFRSGDAGC